MVWGFASRTRGLKLGIEGVEVEFRIAVQGRCHDLRFRNCEDGRTINAQGGLPGK